MTDLSRFRWAQILGALFMLAGCEGAEGAYLDGPPCGGTCGRDGLSLCLRCAGQDVCFGLHGPAEDDIGNDVNRVRYCYGEPGHVCECLESEYPEFDCRPEANGQEVLYSPLVCAAVERQSRLDQGP